MKTKAGSFYSLPLALWISLFFVIPMGMVLGFSFLTRAPGGGVQFQFSFEAYANIFQQDSQGNFIYLGILGYTFFMALVATFLTIVIAIPCAYYMARTKNNTYLIFLVIIPFWVNFLIRVFAWVALLGQTGILNEFLQSVGLIQNPIQFLFNDYAVLLVLVYTNLPFAILPLFTNIEKFDFSLLEAARDLGASHQRSLWSVLLPNIRGGIVTAILFTFIPIFGNFAVPDIVGSSSIFMLGQLITNKLKFTGDYPMASSFSVVILALTVVGLIFYLFYTKTQKKSVQNPINEEEIS